MSAREVIRLIEALPEHERREVVEFVKHGEPAKQSTSAVRRIDIATMKAVAERVFTEHAELFRKLAQ